MRFLKSLFSKQKFYMLLHAIAVSSSIMQINSTSLFFPHSKPFTLIHISQTFHSFFASKMKRSASPSFSFASNEDPHLPHHHVEKRGRYEISKKAVYQLAFPKGTCVLRFSDLSAENVTDTIWIIENHILIRKLELEGPLFIGKPTYFRYTNRYQGWFYDEPWEFMPLTAVSSTKTVDGALTVLFPSTEMIEKGFEVAEKQRLRIHPSENSSRLQLERKVKQLKAIKSRRKKGKKNNMIKNEVGEDESGEGGIEIKMEEEDEECLGCCDDEGAAHHVNEMYEDDE